MKYYGHFCRISELQAEAKSQHSSLCQKGRVYVFAQHYASARYPACDVLL